MSDSLIKIAAMLARGDLLPKIDTEHWYASTPLAERRQIVAAMEAAHEQHKRLALDIREIANAERLRGLLEAEEAKRERLKRVIRLAEQPSILGPALMELGFDDHAAWNGGWSAAVRFIKAHSIGADDRPLDMIPAPDGSRVLMVAADRETDAHV